MGGSSVLAVRSDALSRRAFARLALCVLLAASLLPLVPSGASGLPSRDPKTFYVSITGNDFTGTGTAAKPWATLEKAATQAVIAGDVVRVLPGTYYPPSTISIYRGVKWIGAGLGRTVVWAPGPTGSVFQIAYGDNDTRLEGFEIHGGGGSSGGALTIQGGEAPGWGPIITRNDFIDNGVSVEGGAIYIDGGSSDFCKPLISYNTFQGNEAGINGGAIYVGSDANPYIYRCTFDGNAASGSGIYGGGAIYTSGGRMRVQRCEFYGCEAPDGSGGAIGIDGVDGMVEILETRISGGRAEYGGGIYVNGTDYWTYVRNCRIDSNTSDSWGGGIRVYDASVNIQGTSFVGNRAAGGANYGALSVFDFAPSNDAVTVDSSIFHDNSTAKNDDVPSPSANCDLTITYSYLNETFAGTGNLQGSDPLFFRASPWIERLAFGSPCIDMGNPASTLTNDLENLKRPKDGPDGNTEARVDMGHHEYGTTVGRLAGSDRFATAAAAVQDRYTESPVAIIATGRDFPDALCAAGLAGAYHAPVLLVDTNSLPSAVRTELVNLETREAIIVGGPNSVGAGVETSLRGMGILVTRIAGDNRFDTSRLIANHLDDMGYARNCWIARGDNFPDALALAPLAALRTNPGPVLLTESTRLPAEIRSALRRNEYQYALVAGSTEAVSADVFDAVDAEITARTERAKGSNRYATAVAIARWAMGADYTAGEFIGLAVGDDFPDALAGGAACGYERGLLLLTERGELHSSVDDWIQDNSDNPREIYAFGNGIDKSVLSYTRTIVP